MVLVQIDRSSSPLPTPPGDEKSGFVMGNNFVSVWFCWRWHTPLAVSKRFPLPLHENAIAEKFRVKASLRSNCSLQLLLPLSVTVMPTALTPHIFLSVHICTRDSICRVFFSWPVLQLASNANVPFCSLRNSLCTPCLLGASSLVAFPIPIPFILP